MQCEIGGEKITFRVLKDLYRKKYGLSLSSGARSNITNCRDFVEDYIKQGNVVYGLNTGFGYLQNVRVDDSRITELQYNLIKSHACGTGDVIPADVAKMILALKIISFAAGYSGVRLELVERLITFYNEDVIPVIYEQGSLGASGDLAPLAHLSLPLIGLGEVFYKGEKMSSEDAHKKLDIKPLTLESKEGLALLNGTQFSTAYGVIAVIEGFALLDWAVAAAALSTEAFNCNISFLHENIHQIRNQEGQIKIAELLREYFLESDINKRGSKETQDPYSFRCTPQVLGATHDAFKYTREIVLREVNAVTDNPNVFDEQKMILSGGNFHAQPVALICDFMAISISEIGGISERRLYQLLDGKRELPIFLTPDPGLHNGYMIAQYTAASIVSQNKQLSTPVSIDSIPSSAGQEDHVSMAANGAVRLHKIIKNLKNILAIEWMIASQALDFRESYKPGTRLMKLYKSYREEVKAMKEDRLIYRDIEQTLSFMDRNREELISTESQSA